MLKYLKHTQIDYKKWDDRLLSSSDANVYSVSWYLNIIHPRWEALVLENNDAYQIIMPLLPKRKYVFSLHPSPVLAQRLGIYGNNLTAYMPEIIKKLKNRFIYINYPVDQSFIFPDNQLKIKERKNYVLPLNNDYQEIKDSYWNNRKKSLKQVKKFGLQVRYASSGDNLIRFFKHEVAIKIPGGVNHLTYNRMNKLINYCLENETGFLTEILNRQNEVISAAFFIKFQNRLVYLLSSNSLEAKQKNANSFLLDYIIQKYAGEEVILDFEGSDIKGIAYFYKSFGSVEETFYEIRYQSDLLDQLMKLKQFLQSK